MKLGYKIDSKVYHIIDEKYSAYSMCAWNLDHRNLSSSEVGDRRLCKICKKSYQVNERFLIHAYVHAFHLFVL